jgi:Ca2+-binding RTX toxin-like protein
MAVVNGTTGPDNLGDVNNENDTLNGLAGNDNLTGGRGNDLLDGGLGADKYFYQRGDGQDILSDTGSDENSIDQLIISGNGLTSANVIVTRLGISDDLKISFKDNFTNSIVLKNQVASFFSGSRGVERITFNDNVTWTEEQLWTSYLVAGAASNDRLEGTDLGNRIIGGRGNDYLDGRSGADIYQFQLGDGQDSLADSGWDNASDRLVFTGNGLTSRNAVVTRIGITDDLLISFSGGVIDRSSKTSRLISKNMGGINNLLGRDNLLYGSSGRINDSITLVKQLYLFRPTQGVETILFDDGVTWAEEDLWNAYLVQAPSTNDSLEGTAQGNIVIGGLGNDYMDGRDGADIYRFRRGDGQDKIYDSSNDVSADQLIFSGDGLTSTNAIVTRIENSDDLQISFGGDILDSVILLKQVYDFRPTQGLESITFSNGITWSDLDLRDAYLTLAPSSNDTLLGTENRADVLIGGAGTDFMDGYTGSDTYRFRLGDDQDTIYDSGNDVSVDQLIFSGDGLTSTNAIVTRLGNSDDLQISFGGIITESVILTKQVYDFRPTQGLESITFSNGITWSDLDLRDAYLTLAPSSNDTLLGTENRADVLIGGAGTDFMDGYTGSDTYRFRRGDGQDTIYDSGNDAGSDQLIFSGDGLTSTNAIVTRLANSDDLRISFGGSILDSVILTKQVYDFRPTQGLESITFSNGVTWNESLLVANIR